MMESKSRGVLDTAHARGMTPVYAAAIAQTISARPSAFASTDAIRGEGLRSNRRPRARGDPYAVPSRCGAVADAFRNHERRCFWVWAQGWGGMLRGLRG